MRMGTPRYATYIHKRPQVRSIKSGHGNPSILGHLTEDRRALAVGAKTNAFARGTVLVGHREGADGEGAAQCHHFDLVASANDGLRLRGRHRDRSAARQRNPDAPAEDRKSTRLNSSH